MAAHNIKWLTGVLLWTFSVAIFGNVPQQCKMIEESYPWAGPSYVHFLNRFPLMTMFIKKNELRTSQEALNQELFRLKFAPWSTPYEVLGQSDHGHIVVSVSLPFCSRDLFLLQVYDISLCTIWATKGIPEMAELEGTALALPQTGIISWGITGHWVPRCHKRNPRIMLLDLDCMPNAAFMQNENWQGSEWPMYCNLEWTEVIQRHSYENALVHNRYTSPTAIFHAVQQYMTDQMLHHY